MSDERIESHEERLYVLRDKAAREGFTVPDDALDYIADKYAMETTLKGALINVAAYAARRGLPVDRAMAALVLDGVRPQAASVDAAASAEPEIAEESEDPVEPDEPIEPEIDESSQETYEPHADQSDEPDEPAADDDTAGTAEERPFEPVTTTLFAPPPAVTPPAPSAPEPAAQAEPDLPPFVSAAPPEPIWGSETAADSTPAVQSQPAQPTAQPADSTPAEVWFAPMRSVKKESLVKRVGKLLKLAGLAQAIDDGDLVAIKLHFGEEGNTGFVHPVFLREVVRRVRKHGGKPFLTDCNTLYRGKRANAVDHATCAVRNGFSFSTINAPVIIADGLTGTDGVDVPISGSKHFDSVRIGAAAVHADAMVVVSHVKGHEATGFGGAMKNIGMGLGTRAAKQRMHSDLKPQVIAEKCTAC